MNKHKKRIKSNCWLIIYILVIFSSSIKAQTPISDIIDKYKDLDKLKTFNLKPEQLKAAKEMSCNLDKDSKELILQTNEQYTLTYTGNLPSQDSLYNETIDILKNKKYIMTEEYKDSSLIKETYILSDNDKVTDLVFVLKYNDALIILLSKGNFNKNKYLNMNLTDSINIKL